MWNVAICAEREKEFMGVCVKYFSEATRDVGVEAEQRGGRGERESSQCIHSGAF